MLEQMEAVGDEAAAVPELNSIEFEEDEADAEVFASEGIF